MPKCSANQQIVAPEIISNYFYHWTDVVLPHLLLWNEKMKMKIKVERIKPGTDGERHEFHPSSEAVLRRVDGATRIPKNRSDAIHAARQSRKRPGARPSPVAATFEVLLFRNNPNALGSLGI